MKHAIHFLAGLLLGSAVIVCTGAASAVSQTVTATLTTSPIFLDGSEVTLQGYNIGGHTGMMASIWKATHPTPGRSRSPPPRA